MKTHDLKIWPEFFEMSDNGLKPFEIRKNDRDYRAGDVLHLREWTAEKGYTGRHTYWLVQYVLLEAPGLLPGYCILGLFGPWA